MPVWLHTKSVLAPIPSANALGFVMFLNSFFLLVPPLFIDESAASIGVVSKAYLADIGISGSELMGAIAIALLSLAIMELRYFAPARRHGCRRDRSGGPLPTDLKSRD